MRIPGLAPRQWTSPTTRRSPSSPTEWARSTTWCQPTSSRARGKLADLQRDNLRMSFDTKVIGSAMLAKYFAPQINPGGSFVLFSGVHAFKLNVGDLEGGRRRTAHLVTS
jgi:hypothetical protein